MIPLVLLYTTNNGLDLWNITYIDLILIIRYQNGCKYAIIYSSKILHVAKNIFSNLGCIFLKTNMNNFRQPIRIHLEETETFPLT